MPSRLQPMPPIARRRDQPGLVTCCLAPRCWMPRCSVKRGLTVALAVACWLAAPWNLPASGWLGQATAAAQAGSQAGTQAESQASVRLSPADQQAVAQVVQLVRRAGELYQASQFAESGEQIDRAVAAVAQLTKRGDRAIDDALAPLIPRIINAHALLELEGIELTPFEPPARPESSSQSQSSQPGASQPRAASERAAMGGAAAKERAMAGEADADADSGRRSRRGRSGSANRRGGSAGSATAGPADRSPSFVYDVAPILVQRCGACHIQETRGDFSVANFALLARGTPAGTVIFPGDVVASRLIESIETGDMPRGDQQVTPEELQTLKDWVQAGARFDGPSPLLPMVAMAAAAAERSAAGGSTVAGRGRPARSASDDRSASGAGGASGDSATDSTVSFATQIAPILLEHCSGCHIDAPQVRGGLRMDTFALLMRGGADGPIVQAGDPDSSSLVRRLRGEDEPRMPAGRPPLSDQQIALIAQWIEEQAPLGQANPDQPLQRMATEAWAAGADAQELTQRRQELAQQHMNVAGVGASEVFQLESERFLVIGNTTQAIAEQVLEAAENISKRLQGKLDIASLRGRTTVFVMPRRYDYSEFAKMVEQRSVPADWQAHWRIDAADAYLVVLGAPSDGVADFEQRLVAPLTSLAISSLGRDVPRWFADGVGKNEAAAALGRRGADEVARWNAAVPAAATAMERAEQVERGQLSPEQTEAIGYGAVATMQKLQRRPYQQLLSRLGDGPFEAVFTQAFGVAPNAYLDQWKAMTAPAADRRR